MVYFVLLALTIALFGLPLSLFGWLLPQRWVHGLAQHWGKVNLWLQNTVCGLSYRIEGLENLPPPPLIVMAKHQSAWETIALRGLLHPQQSWVLKRELLWIPVFGWALVAAKNIAIDRRAGRKAVKQIISQGLQRLADGSCVVIFPEGTRTAPGTRGKYGIGGGLLAEKANAPVIPIAHNAGVFWPRRQLRKFPGTIQVKIGAPIDTAGLNAAQITRAVENWIEEQQTRMPQTLQQAVQAAGRPAMNRP